MVRARTTEPTHLGWGVDVAHVRCNTGCAADVVEAERGDEGVRLEEKRQRLANASSRAQDSDFCVSGGRRGKEASLAENRACN